VIRPAIEHNIFCMGVRFSWSIFCSSFFPPLSVQPSRRGGINEQTLGRADPDGPSLLGPLFSPFSFGTFPGFDARSDRTVIAPLPYANFASFCHCLANF